MTSIPRGRGAVAVRLTLGFALLIVGIAGLFLPFLQGILMILAGLLILSRDLPFVGRFLAATARRFPKLSPMIQRAELDVIGFTDGLSGDWRKLLQHPLLLMLSLIGIVSLILAILHIFDVLRLF